MFSPLLGPGLKLADASVFISCAMSLAVFDISKGVDESGKEIEPTVEYTSGTIRYCLLVESMLWSADFCYSVTRIIATRSRSHVPLNLARRRASP